MTTTPDGMPDGGVPAQAQPPVIERVVLSDAELRPLWEAEKAAHADLMDVEKTAFEAARDSVKQLLSLATGIIALTITFAKEYVASLDVGRWMALSAWGLLLLSAFAGLWALNALTGNAGALKPKAWLSTRSFNVTLPSTVQVLSFLGGLILIVVYAGAATNKASQMRVADDTIRRLTVRALAEEQLYWSVNNQITSRGGRLDTTGTVVLRRLASAAAMRIDYRSPSDSLSVVEHGAERWAVQSLSDAGIGSPVRNSASTMRGLVNANNLSRALFRLCPLYPFC